MTEKIIWGIIIIVAVIGVWFLIGNRSTEEVDNTASSTPKMTASMSEIEDGTYTLDTQNSVINWTGHKTLIVDYYDHGTLSLSSGFVMVQDGEIVDGDFVVDMNSFAVSSTGNQKPGSMLENHLKSADFFDVANNPIAKVALKSVVDGVVTADVTIKGITNEVEFPTEISQDGNTITAKASFEIDRTLWDVRYGSTKFFQNLGDSVIADTVAIELDLKASKGE